MKKQELIDALSLLAMGRMDAVLPLADLLMPEPAADPAPAAHDAAKPARKAK